MLNHTYILRNFKSLNLDIIIWYLNSLNINNSITRKQLSIY